MPAAAASSRNYEYMHKKNIYIVNKPYLPSGVNTFFYQYLLNALHMRVIRGNSDSQLITGNYKLPKFIKVTHKLQIFPVWFP